MRCRTAGITAILALGAMLTGTQAQAANPLEKNFWLSGPRYDGVLPPCDAPAALQKVADHFADKERTYWASSLTILAFDQVRETSFRPWAVDTIPRRWCAGVAHVSDGHAHAVYFQIAEDQGMIGASFGVEFCVVGLDRNWAFNPACKMARP